MAKTIEVDYREWYRIASAVYNMQDRTFYCEDDEGILRRWTPPAPPRQKGEP